jgi:hypothetical protein
VLPPITRVLLPWENGVLPKGRQLLPRTAMRLHKKRLLLQISQLFLLQTRRLFPTMEAFL